ncbi:MAG TPA: glycerol-3-phosphate dehydrogenase C-terminal domain-containing protein, partial [Pelomicrobium sp.]|nr:glycerol-3-phosphate dehydrogenase C-terminal domain-containing protein [Pelomicrobium sp.]
LPAGGVERLAAQLREERPGLPGDWIDAAVQRYGSRAERLIGEARALDDLGERYTPFLFAREVAYLAEHEWACTADDVLWRRTREGLACGAAGRERLAQFLAVRQGAGLAVAECSG